MEGTCNVKHSIDTIFILSYMRIPSFFFRDIKQIFEIGQSYGKRLNADKEILM